MLGWNRRSRGPEVAAPAQAESGPASRQSVLLFPTTFPLTVGGATFALLVSFAAQTSGLAGRGILSIPAEAYAALTAVTLFGAGLGQQLGIGAGAGPAGPGRGHTPDRDQP